MDDQRTDRERGVDQSRSVGSILIGLMIITGLFLLIGAIPWGLCFGPMFFWGDWWWAAMFSCAMTLATASLGGVLLGVGEYIHRGQKAKNNFPTR